jgi:excisionase family DNA binding protein
MQARTVSQLADEPRFLTLDEVAAYFRVSKRTMLEYVRQHPYYRMIGKRKLFTQADVLALEESLKCPSNSAPQSRGERRTSRYAEPTSEFTSTDLLKHLTERSRGRCSKRSKPTSNVAPFPTKTR